MNIIFRYDVGRAYAERGDRLLRFAVKLQDKEGGGGKCRCHSGIDRRSKSAGVYKNTKVAKRLAGIRTRYMDASVPPCGTISRLTTPQIYATSNK